MTIASPTATDSPPSAESASPAPTIAILPWGNVIEDYLNPIGVSFASFRDEMTAGWLFGYVDALRTAGVRTVLIVLSDGFRTAQGFTHRPTGATIRVLPAPRFYRWARRPMHDPYGWTLAETYGRVGEWRPRARQLRMVLRDVAPYLATPLRGLARTLRAERCAALLCQEYEYARFDASVLVGKLLRLPVFATFQGGDSQVSRIERFLRPRTLQACDGVIVAAGTEAARLRERYEVPPQKIARIFNPLDLTLWYPVDRAAARTELGIAPEARVAVWHGRVAMHNKGLDVLAAAWENVCRKRPGSDLQLLIVGTGRDRDELGRLIAQRALPGMRWVEEYVLDRGAMRRFLSAADVYAFPSRHEGLPVAPVEAMACGLPVVATEAQGIPDILAGGRSAGGIVVARDDVAGFAEALGGLLDDTALARELGGRARRRVESSFSLEIVGTQLRDLLLRSPHPVAH